VGYALIDTDYQPLTISQVPLYLMSMRVGSSLDLSYSTMDLVSSKVQHDCIRYDDLPDCYLQAIVGLED